MRCFEVLKLPESATEAQIRARYRELAAQFHPDKGGDVEVFHLLCIAYEDALKIASEAPIPPKCLSCNDTGRVTVQFGFNRIHRLCCDCAVVG